jgi:PAS domain S-box-containing protein
MERRIPAKKLEIETLKVTIIEDEDAHLELMERTIKREFPDAQTDSFREISGCLDCIDQINPDIIITDYLLPDMNGLEFLEELQRRHKEIPVVVVTGQGDENIAVKAMKLGAYDYIVKSADFFSLVPSIIEKVILRKKLKRALQESQALYEQERNKLNSILASMVNPLAEIDENMTINFANPVFERTFGKDLIGKPCEAIFGKSCDVNAPCRKAIKDRQIQNREFEDINGRIWHITIAPGIELEWGMVTAVLVFQDITERKQAQEALLENEQRLSQIVQGSSIPTFVIDTNHIITYWNKACENLTGISASAMIGTPRQWLAFYSAERPVMADLIVDNVPGEEMARYYGGKYHESAVIDGAYEAEDFFPDLGERGKCLFFTAAPLRDIKGRVIGAIETLQDITERKAYERQLQHLSERMIDLQEEERSRISRELHDELGQVLTALKFDAAWLRRYLPEGEIAAKKRFQEMCDLIDGSLSAVRRISSGLRPGILDDMGLEAAIEWHAKEFQQRFGIECVTLLDLPKKRLANHLETGIYRIVQEALTNIARHAKASMVTISTEQKDQTLSVKIVDNGIGIEPSRIQSPLSTGISGMRERAEILSGTMEIRGKSGKGTEVTVKVPLTYRHRQFSIAGAQ